MALAIDLATPDATEVRSMPIFLRMRTSDIWKGDPEQFYLDSYADDNTHTVLVKELSIEVEVPLNFDPRPQMVKKLEAERDEIRAQFSKAIADVNRRLQELQAIECSPEAA